MGTKQVEIEERTLELLESEGHEEETISDTIGRLIPGSSYRDFAGVLDGEEVEGAKDKDKNKDTAEETDGSEGKKEVTADAEPISATFETLTARAQAIPDPVPELEGLEQEIIDEIVPKIEGGESLDADDSNKILLFFTLSHAIIEHRSTRLLHSSLIHEEFQHSNATWNLLGDKLGQYLRQELLHRCGVIGSGLYAKVNEVRKARNDLVHDPHERMEMNSLDKNGFERLVRDTVEGVRELDDVLKA